MKEIKSIDCRKGYNGIIVKSQETLENGVMKLCVLDSAAENMANIILKKVFESETYLVRQGASQIEWAKDIGGKWEPLCSIDDDIVLALSEKTGFAKHERPQEKNVIFTIKGNDLRFRGKDWLKEGYDISNDTLLRGHINGNFQQLWLREIPSDKPLGYMGEEDTYSFKCTCDNIPPLNLNKTYIGALHGYYCISWLPNVFGLTEASIGEIFVRKSDSQKYMLVRACEELVWFCPFDEEAMQTGDFGKYATGKNQFLLFENDVLTDESGREYHIAENATQQQFRFSTNHRVQRAFLNGVYEVELLKDGTYEADFVDFYESYDIIYLPAMLNYLRENKGKNIDDKHNSEMIEGAYANFASTHRFHRNGSYTVYQTNTILADVYDVFYYGVMAMPYNSNAPHYIYAPESKNISVPTYHFKETIFARGNPKKVRSFYHMTDEKGTKSTNVGYYPYFANGKTEERIDAVRGYSGTDVPEEELLLAMYYSSHKMYPYYYNKRNMGKGEKVSLIGYHTPAVPIDEDFFAINWHFVGEEIYLSLNCDKSVDKTVTALPEYLNGLKITIEQKSEGFEVKSTVIENGSISVSSNGCGYAILKLTKN